jgi:cyclopropane fatty-acyl-phospholipid synthase-like methyltransferase
MSSYERFLERYQDERIPWDDPLPPPELIELAQRLPPGRALDLGCGFGRAAIYLALRGWSADGVDFVAQAIDEARRRAEAARVAPRAKFYHSSVTDLRFLQPPYDLAIDIGCMHSFDEDELRAYAGELHRLLIPGGYFLLFAHAHQDSWVEIDPVTGEETQRSHGIPEASILELFADGFVLERVERGSTQVEDRPPWPSAWFWFRRQEGESNA